MENPEPSDQTKKTLQRNSNSHISISDTDSTLASPDGWHSLPPSDSPLQFDDPCFYPENGVVGNKSGKALASATDKFFSLLPSPRKLKEWSLWPQFEKAPSRKESMPAGGAPAAESKNKKENHDLAVKVDPPLVLSVNKLVQAEPAQVVKKVEVPVGDGGGVLQEHDARGRDEELGGDDPRFGVSKGGVSMMTAALTFRVLSGIICLISFSVMAADRTQGWTGDSFDRYIEYRFCVAVNVVGFAYSGFQALDLGSQFGTEKHTPHRWRCCFDFCMDQMLSYLLVSASSSAATRVNEWILNWGRDQFTTMASASIALSFLAFIGFAFSTLISGYNLRYCDSR